VTGIVCNGEIGPIGGKTYIHGFTNSIGIIVDNDPPPPLKAGAPSDGGCINNNARKSGGSGSTE
jgi:hypothetical protein